MNKTENMYKEAFEDEGNGEKIEDIFSKYTPKTLEDAKAVISDLNTRVAGLEEVIRLKDDEITRAKRDKHKAWWEYHGLQMETLDRRLAE